MRASPVRYPFGRPKAAERDSDGGGVVTSEEQRLSSSSLAGADCEARFRVWAAMNGLKREFERFELGLGMNGEAERSGLNLIRVRRRRRRRRFESSPNEFHKLPKESDAVLFWGI